VVKRKPLTQRAIPPSLRAGRLLRDGDLLLEKSGGGDQQPVGVVVLYDLPDQAVCSNFISRLACADGYRSKYLCYLHATLYAIGLNVRSIKQTTGIQNLDSKAYLQELVAFPPIEEQDLIARFLDWANGRVERAIRAKRKVIALLNEQKQAIIHRAVTRGLDPSVPLKPSGIPWLGDIPQHWEVWRARYLFRAITRRDVRSGDPKLSVTQKRGIVQTDDMQENSTQAKSFDRFQVCYPNDLVLNKYKAHLGVFCCASERGLITPNYTVLRPIRSLKTRYYDLLLHTGTYRNFFRTVVYGVTEGMSPLYTEDFYRTPVLMPPISEQEAILDRLEELTRSQDGSIRRLEREIQLIDEYRSRLLADVVTGKLDVREAATHLPDEGEPEIPEIEEELDPAEADEEVVA
jgi:type I restriction enzyme S subunit